MRQWLEGIEQQHGIDRLTSLSRQWVLISFSLLLLMMLFRGFMVQGDAFNWRPMIAFVLPLVLFLPSIIGRRPRGHAWLAFVSLLYFSQGVMVATLPTQTLRGVVEALLSLALFSGCMAYARFRSRQVRAQG
ncbi:MULTISPECIES: DUF2069 domain-containing protein [unclassified Halomonas]|uniref:DUF2069 domain-containing protein n=1 Tax=unclassified Halomonas TaxID=2609666 RepID=UPI0006DA6BBD|nr:MULTISPECIES: DUF2069 domain-containing protein [unclassified Halomonas]KPQ19778.1 MAG: membrane protein of unknown function DUF2069 [Halomonas sp. HL-93]SBR48782.1 Predicted membrane protein (DUF2069) [Halomonas sp. HL-93]SNY96110.1 Predicted membrane protein [Halomonas sp. hl-4]